MRAFVHALFFHYKNVESIAKVRCNIEFGSSKTCFCQWLSAVGINPQLFFASVLDTLFELDRFEEALSDLVSFQQLSCSLEPVIAKFLAHITRFIKCGKELLENKDILPGPLTAEQKAKRETWLKEKAGDADASCAERLIAQEKPFVH